MEKMVFAYADEVKHSLLKVNVIDPGRVRTMMRADAYPGEDPSVLPSPDDIMDIFVECVRPDYAASGRILKAA